jgi:hypothetical protein
MFSSWRLTVLIHFAKTLTYLKQEGFDSAALLQDEVFCVKPFHENLVEVADDGHEQEKYGVFRHE